MIEAEAVLFAIQAALKVYAGVRQAYVDSTRDTPLTLPLPRPTETNVQLIVDYFNGDPAGQRIRDSTPVVQALIKPPLSDENRQELITLYLLYNGEPGDGADQQISGDDLAKLLTVRQWTKAEDKTHFTAVQLIAGTLIDIAVDYFANTPGAVSQNRPEGKVLLAFLTAMNKVEFASTPAALLGDKLMVGVLDAVGATPGLLVAGAKEQLLVTGMTTALAKAVNDNLGTTPTSEQRLAAGEWIQVVAAAVAKGASDTVLANPALFLPGDDNAGSKVLQSVLSQVSALAIGPDKVELQNLFSEKGLTTVAQAALGAVARNPEILGTDNTGLKKLVSEVAGSLAANPLPAGKDLAPQLVGLVLDRSAANLDLLWGGDRNDPGRNLLVVAAKQTLTALSAAANGAQKPPTFAQDQLLSILDAVFAQVEENPDWVVAQVAGGDPTLSAALAAALGALKGHAPSKLSAAVVHAILLASLEAVGARLEFLDKLPPPDADAGKAVLGAAIDAVLSAVFDDTMPAARRWQLAQSSVIQSLVQTSLTVLAKKGVTPANIVILRLVLHDMVEGKVLPGGFAAALDGQLP